MPTGLRNWPGARTVRAGGADSDSVGERVPKLSMDSTATDPESVSDGDTPRLNALGGGKKTRWRKGYRLVCSGELGIDFAR